jgi:hypothetical protein
VKVLVGRDEAPQRRFAVRVLWEPRDAWVGVFTNRAHEYRLIYVCLLPCLPIVFIWGRSIVPAVVPEETL